MHAAKPPRHRHLFLLLRLACAIALLAWVFSRLDMRELGSLSWSTLEISWLGLAFGLGGVSVLAWAGRWWWFLRVYDLRARYGELLRLTLFADFFNLYFLGPLGADGIRMLLLSRRFPEHRGAILGSLILDHIGGLVGGAVLFVLFAQDSQLPDAVLSSTQSALIVFGLITFLGLGVIMEPPVQRLFARIPGLAWLARQAAPIFAGTFRHPWLFSGFGVSALGTACAYAAYACAARSLGLDVQIVQMLGLMPVVDVIASLPVTLSGIGVREGLLVTWLGAQPGIGDAKALATSLLGFAALGLWGLIGGIWLAFWRRNHPMDQTTA